jgi:formylglycine-generating enzyme required for sulfatase activity
MRFSAASLFLLVGCTGGGPQVVPSERGPDMVRVDGGTVRLGRRQTPPVAGFSWGASPLPGQPLPGGPAPGGPAGAPGGPIGPPPPPGGSVPPPPGAPPPGGGARLDLRLEEEPSLANVLLQIATSAVPPAAADVPPRSRWKKAEEVVPKDTGVVPAARGEAPQPLPDLGLAPGATPGAGNLPQPDPLEPRLVDVSPFWIDLTEVTQAQYAAFLQDTRYRPPFVDEAWAADGWNWDSLAAPAATADHPVVLTSWWDASNYCEWAGKRLPTEAEWQLAVLGGADDERLFPWGDEYDGARLNHGTFDLPNYDASDGYERTSPVGAFPEGASRWGLQDAFGNAWEWVADWRVGSWDDVLGERREGRVVDPHTAPQGLYAAVRGGAFFFDFRPNPAGERSAFLPELRRKSAGFRCAKDP